MVGRIFAAAVGLGAFVLSATAVLAQDWQVITPPTSARLAAIGCPLNDPVSGNALCVSLGCAPGGDLGWQLEAVGGDLPEPLTLTLSVDGAAPQVLEMARPPEGQPLVRQAAFDPEGHAALVGQLKAGAQAQLSWPFGGTDVRFDLGLRGSSRAIGEVMGTCLIPPPAPVTDPAANILAEITQECRTLGGTVAEGEGFVMPQDLNADGQPDLVINWGGIRCSAAASLYCGSAGCFTSIWLAQDAGYRRLYGGNVHGVLPRPGGGFDLALHGSYCGKVGYEACTHSYTIEAGQAVRVDGG